MSDFVIWGLFDSGNGSYKKGSEKFNKIDLYSIGLDRQNENSHFINLDLSDYDINYSILNGGVI